MSRRVSRPHLLEQRVSLGTRSLLGPFESFLRERGKSVLQGFGCVLSAAVVAWATPLRDRQGDFARKSVLAPVKAHLTSELNSNDIFNDARTEAAMRGPVTEGPPDSIQRKLSHPSATLNHVTSTRPVAADSAPYFAALVASSVRGFLAGVVRKKLGLNLVSELADKGRVYRILDGNAASAGAKSNDHSRKRSAVHLG